MHSESPAPDDGIDELHHNGEDNDMESMTQQYELVSLFALS